MNCYSYHSIEFVDAEVACQVYTPVADVDRGGVRLDMSTRSHTLRLTLDVDTAERVIGHLVLMVEQARRSGGQAGASAAPAAPAAEEAAPW